jgi:hypothetical protein
MEAVNQNVQRGMAGLAMAQVKHLISVATNTALLAAEAAGVDVEGMKADVLPQIVGTLQGSAEAFKFAAGLTKDIVGGAGAGKEFAALNNVIAKLGGEGARVSLGGAPAKKQVGGNVYPAQTGRNVYSVAEDGRPELFHSGSGSNTLFAPGEAGRIFNANETMNTFQKGLGGGGGGGGGAPTVNRSGGGEKTVLNITINAGTLDKGSFAKLLETEILNHIYR